MELDEVFQDFLDLYELSYIFNSEGISFLILKSKCILQLHSGTDINIFKSIYDNGLRGIDIVLDESRDVHNIYLYNDDESKNIIRAINMIKESKGSISKTLIKLLTNKIKIILHENSECD